MLRALHNVYDPYASIARACLRNQPLVRHQTFVVLLIRTRSLFIVVCHLQSCPLEPALDIKSFIGLAAIQNALVASDFFRNIIQCLYYSQAELLSLLVLGHYNVFDVTDHAEIMYKFSLNNDGTSPDDGIVFIADHEDVISIVAVGHEIVSGVEVFLREFANGGQYS